MANLTRRWKKFLAVGCSHGHLACPKALKAVLTFRDSYKPDYVAHLGDFVDVAALRSGAHGTKDETADIDYDLKCGTNFLERLEPNTIFFGNHDDRLERLQNHPKAVVAYCAGKIMGEINDLAHKLRANIVPYGIHVGWKRLGNYLLGHGYNYGEAAIRDHAESVGNCIIAHLHRTGEERGRRLEGATGYCVGTLASIGSLEYAKTRRATLKWNMGFAWGEYCDSATVVSIARRADTQEWRLP